MLQVTRVSGNNLLIGSDIALIEGAKEMSEPLLARALQGLNNWVRKLGRSAGLDESQDTKLKSIRRRKAIKKEPYQITEIVRFFSNQSSYP